MTPTLRAYRNWLGGLVDRRCRRDPEDEYEEDTFALCIATPVDRIVACSHKRGHAGPHSWEPAL